MRGTGSLCVLCEEGHSRLISLWDENQPHAFYGVVHSLHTTHQQCNCLSTFRSVASLQAPCEVSRPAERHGPRAGKPEKRVPDPLHLHPQVCIPIQAYARQLTDRDERSMRAKIKSAGYNVRPIEPGNKNWDQMMARRDIASTWGSQRV